MANVSVTNTFANDTVADASQVNTNFTDLVNYINNRNGGSASWDAVSASSTSNIPIIANNSSGTQSIAELRDNGTNVVTVADGGTTTLRCTGTTEKTLVVNNSSSTGNIIEAQDNGNAVLTVADAGTTTVRCTGTTEKALVVNNGTSTGNILELQDNGNPVMVVADGGIITSSGQSACRAIRATSTQNVTGGVVTKVQFNSETFDVQNEFDSATNYNFTATVAGKYFVTSSVALRAGSATNEIHIYIYKNGALHSDFFTLDRGSTDSSIAITDVLSLAATDTVDIRVQNVDEDDVIGNGTGMTYVAIYKVA